MHRETYSLLVLTGGAWRPVAVFTAEDIGDAYRQIAGLLPAQFRTSPIAINPCELGPTWHSESCGGPPPN